MEEDTVGIFPFICCSMSNYFLYLLFSAVQVQSGSVCGISGKMTYDYFKDLYHWTIPVANGGIKCGLVTH